MLLQTNSYVVPKDKRAEHERLMRRFRQTLARLGCDQFEVYEQVGANWSGGENGRYVQIMRFRDRKHQLAVQSAERSDASAQALISEFCTLVNFQYQQQQGLFAVGFYNSTLPVVPTRVRSQRAANLGSAFGDEEAEPVEETDEARQTEEIAAAEEAGERLSGHQPDMELQELSTPAENAPEEAAGQLPPEEDRETPPPKIAAAPSADDAEKTGSRAMPQPPASLLPETPRSRELAATDFNGEPADDESDDEAMDDSDIEVPTEIHFVDVASLPPPAPEVPPDSASEPDDGFVSAPSGSEEIEETVELAQVSDTLDDFVELPNEEADFAADLETAEPVHTELNPDETPAGPVEESQEAHPIQGLRSGNVELH